MTFSKQIITLLLLFLFPFILGHASNPKKCSSSFKKPLRCGPLDVPIRFPFCDHPGFNLHCNNLNKTVLEVPRSGTFLVREIDYIKQQIYLNDPKNCLAKRLLNFNVSGSLFFPPFNIYYTLLACPNEEASYRYRPMSIPCLNNSTFSFFATSKFDLAQSMLSSYNCEVAKDLFVPASMPIRETGFSSYINNQSILLQWDSPDCRSCELDKLRCGFKNKTSLEVKCFGAKRGYLSNKTIILIICFAISGVIVSFVVLTAWIGCCIYNIEISDSPRRGNEDTTTIISTLQPRWTTATRGLDQSTIKSYKKMELGESRRLPGTNGIVCTICLSEYASKETVRFIPKCNHCFHVECIDPWLKIHGSCPLCRNSHREDLCS